MATSVINDIKNYKFYHFDKTFTNIEGNSDVVLSVSDMFPANAHVVFLMPIGYTPGSAWATQLLVKEVDFASDGVTPQGIKARAVGNTTQNYNIRFWIMYY